LNAASYTTNVAPGTWVAIYGSQLAPGPLAASSTPFPLQLNGVSVTIAGVAAPLSYVSPGQINALVPFEAASLIAVQTARVPLIVTAATGVSSSFGLLLTASAPAIFTKNLAGTGDALVFAPFSTRFLLWAQVRSEARSSYEKALVLTQQEPERQFLQERIRQLKLKNGVAVQLKFG
jgi:uncharacterized protein (TIGR03437 family)